MRLFRRPARRAGDPHARGVTAAPHERALVQVDATLVPPPTGRTWRVRVWGSHWPHRAHVVGRDDAASPTAVRVSLTDRRLVVARRDRGDELVAFDRGDVRWVARSGREGDGRVIVRCSFVDESFVDLALDARSATTLLSATADLGR